MIKINYHNITHEDMINGDGIRVVLWVSGCSHHCYNCQNENTWNIKSGIKFDKKAKEEIFSELNKNYCTGITFSGGDPLHPKNRKKIYHFIKRYLKKKYPTKTIWIYSGYTFEQLLKNKYSKKILKLIDVLVDGIYIEKLKSPDLPWVGSSNQRVIDVQKSLKENKIILKEG